MESTLRRTWSEIDLDALKYNYSVLRDKVGKSVKFLGVVKADAMTEEPVTDLRHGADRRALIISTALRPILKTTKSVRNCWNLSVSVICILTAHQGKMKRFILHQRDLRTHVLSARKKLKAETLTVWRL